MAEQKKILEVRIESKNIDIISVILVEISQKLKEGYTSSIGVNYVWGLKDLE